MALVEADILSRVNQICKRSESNIDDFLSEAAREISERTFYNKTSVSGTLSASTNTISKPSDCIDVDVVYLGEDVYDKITFEEWRKDKRAGFAIRGNTIYIAPDNSSSRSYTLYYTKYGDVTDFPNEYKMSFIYLCASKLFEHYNIDDEASKFLQKYEYELKKLVPEDELPVCKCKRI